MFADESSDRLVGFAVLGIFFFLLAVYVTCNSRKCRAATEKANAIDPEATIIVDGEPMTMKREFVAAFWRVCAAVQVQGSKGSAVGMAF